MKYNFAKEKKDQPKKNDNAKIEYLIDRLARATLRIKDLEDELSALRSSTYKIGPGKPSPIDPLRELVAQSYRPDMRAFVIDERDVRLHRLIPETEAAGIRTVIFKHDPEKWKKFKEDMEKVKKQTDAIKPFIVKPGKAENRMTKRY